ncbi:hypothetical protein RO3G_04022 [Rhizopus delemar RA 99-880]|uniref:Uncharacterized protein n=1 Tax=Rhizopus delemar (strain RA 99-880 / ATCC MYA-4621 / FGSC 9543 / NRRL 43880) TaxID=246409 RepID=I1BSY7_RHIO9|nr:hypothetical protein RO3G_04022 [Rhizopus delemar RA 99-880]|eukprot:EIE79317.1 hypothetical protein RO3G_04022 [Rhizopus delemar RA 99-880]
MSTMEETAEIDFKKAINEMLNSSSQELKDWATDVIFTDFGYNGYSGILDKWNGCRHT